MSTGLEVNLAGIKLEHPIMNAAGTCKLVEHVEKLSNSNTAAIMVGSFTMERREGNEGEVYWSTPGFSLNSLGLPNPGADYYRENLPKMVSIAHDAGKPLFVSLAGFTRWEYVDLCKLAIDAGVDMVELNLACPNVWEGNSQKEIISYDPYEIKCTTYAVQKEIHTYNIRRSVNFPLSIKISPLYPKLLREALQAVYGVSMVKIITAVNCFPNAMVLGENGKPMISPGGGLAGLGGPAMLPIGLGQVKQIREILDKSNTPGVKEMEVIGVGGIKYGQNVLDYLRCGASAVQVNTAYADEGESVFTRMLQEYVELLD